MQVCRATVPSLCDCLRALVLLFGMLPNVRVDVHRSACEQIMARRVSKISRRVGDALLVCTRRKSACSSGGHNDRGGGKDVPAQCAGADSAHACCLALLTLKVRHSMVSTSLFSPLHGLSSPCFPQDEEDMLACCVSWHSKRTALTA